MSVVLPCYLEEENLRLLLPRLRGVLATIPLSSEVLVVDTTSPLDATGEVAALHGARLVRRRPGNTFGDAVRTGLEEARGELIAFMDADGSHSPELLPELLGRSAGADVVIASRYVPGGYTENDVVLRTMSRLLNVSYSVVLGLDVRDASNSFRVYRRAVLEGIRLRCQNFDIVEEILVKIRRRHRDARMVEIPCTFKKRMFGRTKRSLVRFVLTYVATMLRLRFSR